MERVDFIRSEKPTNTQRYTLYDDVSFSHWMIYEH